jgi:phosphoglycerate kinase
VLLLENLRFHPEEKKNDAAFARRLASLADAYVNDAFVTCHRAHASVSALPACFERPAAGLLVEREIQALGQVLGEPDAPFAAVLGGAKVSDKLPVIESLLARVNLLLIGGAMAHTFLLAEGHGVGSSLVERDLVDTVKRLNSDAASRGVRILTPVDYVVARDKDTPEGARTVSAAGFGEADCGVDVGEETRAAYTDALASCRTILWNGPMGVFETPPFDAGTRAVAEAVAAAEAFSVVGGGDSVAALNELELAASVSHVSTGGGAMLELIAGDELPGLSALAAAETA